MKKFAIILFLASLLLTVTACGNKEESQTEATLESGIANNNSLSQGDPITTPEIGNDESEISSTPSDSNEEVSTPESDESEEESQITQSQPEEDSASQPEDESEESKEEFEENPKDDSAEETQENSKEESVDQSQEESEDDTYISQEPIPNGPRPR